MAFIIDAAYDAALDYLRTNGTRIDITSTEATTYAEATSTLTLGNTQASGSGCEHYHLAYDYLIDPPSWTPPSYCLAYMAGLFSFIML